MRLPRSLLWALLPLGGGGAAAAVHQFPVAVEAAPAERGEVVAEVLGVGALESASAAQVSFEVAGRVTALAVDEGATVRVGDPLGTLDSDDAGRDLAVAGASEAAAASGVSRAAAELARARATAARAGADRARADAIFAAGDQSVAAHDAAVEAESSASAAVAALEAALEQARHVQEGAARARLIRAEVVADGLLRSPVDGLVITRSVEVGERVGAGAPAFAIVSTEAMRVSAWVDETALASLAVGQPARLVFRSEPERSYPGRVERIAREVDRTTHELVVDVTALELPTNFAVGQRADAWIEVGRRTDAVTVPRGWCETGCRILEGGRAVARPVTLGLVGHERVEVVAGLEAGAVVLAPEAPLGRRVRPQVQP